MSGSNLQHKESAARSSLRLENGQDTTEYVLIIILLVLAFTLGALVWTKSVQGSYRVDECAAERVESGLNGNGGAQGRDCGPAP